MTSYVVRAGLFVMLLAQLAACAKEDAKQQSLAGLTYDVDIRWTSYGIPHVKARDWGSLGYGFAYATGEDGVCVFSKEVALAKGTLSAHAGATDADYESDVFHRALLSDERIARLADNMSPNTRQFNTGFVAGYNRFLRDNDGKLPASCNGKSWLQPIDAADLARMQIAFGIRYGLGQFKADIARAAPPGETVARGTTRFNPMPGLGSNAVALGAELTESGRGTLLGNPHYPWHGPARFHMIHTTIPGVVDSMGASLLAGNFIVIGFNADIAWTHTVSTAMRFALYELELNPDNPLEYRFGDGFRPIEKRPVKVELRQEDGTPVEREHAIYMSHYGPLLMSDQLPWTADKAYAMRDAIFDNDSATATYEALQTAKSVDDVEAAIRLQGTYFVNTIAADREGNAFYADMSATPNIDTDTLADCRKQVAGLPPFLVILDGARPDCEWIDDPRSKVPGNLPADLMPSVKSRDFFTNSNDSHWLANPARPLEGYPATIGPEGTARSLRTRAGLQFLNEQLALDGNLSVDEVQELLYNHRHFGAELLLADLLTLCEGDTMVAVDDKSVDIAGSCTALENWDQAGRVTSRGTHVWTEFWESARSIPDVFAVPFAADDPLNTPRGLALDKPQVRAALRQALARGQLKLQAAGIEPQARWGDVQFAERNGKRIPIPGAPGRHGMFSYINANFTDGKGYTPILQGNSYIQVISWDDKGRLDAHGILTYSQSPEADSPHYADMTELYARGEWLDLPFTEEEIMADPNLKSLRLRE